MIYKILGNRIYLGEAVHKGMSHPGEHAAIVERDTWDKVHGILAGNARRRGNISRAQTPALLRGLIFAAGAHAMTPSHTRKAGRLYRYYVATDAIRGGHAACPVRSVPAAEIEDAVVAQVRHLLQTPEIVARTCAAANPDGEVIPPGAGGGGAHQRVRAAVGGAVPGGAGAHRPAVGRARRRG